VVVSTSSDQWYVSTLCLLLIQTNTSQITAFLKHHQNDPTLKTEMPLIVHWPVHVDVHIGYNVPFLSFQLSFTRAPRFSSRLQAPETPNRRQSLLWELGIYIVTMEHLMFQGISIAIKLMSLFLRTAQASCKRNSS